jgi:hypothetical protein
VLTLSKSISFVRARIDEIAYNQDDMILAALDDRNLDTTIEQLLPESAEVVFRSVPVQMLEPEVEFDSSTATPGDYTQSGVNSINHITGENHVDVELDGGAKLLRLVYFSAADSPIVVTSAVPFNSPLARQQSNPYVRGTYDAPVLVQRNLANGGVRLYYFGTEDAAISFGYIRKSVYRTDEQLNKYIFCPRELENNVLNILTGKILETYGDNRSELFYKKASIV